MENVSVFSNTSAFFDLDDGEMDVNMSILTYPAGGNTTVRIVLIGDDAFVNSMGTWRHLKRGSDGFDAVFSVFKYNPLSLVGNALSSGLCNVTGSEGSFKVECSGVEEDFLNLIKTTVGAPQNSKVSVSSPRISLEISGGRIISGELVVGFEISKNPGEESWFLNQVGTVREEFKILGINEDLDLSPPEGG
ncbi:hypothetical protein A3L09_01005 [Thermococcus profundus]|uniref:Uncharacterized protein n=1 Tax=Thermococcus profundus TaxID=49899 RepID=A0A2Z2MJ08_THEPR|nr:hypothetical protein A3L09_01005 [Thermococcus profundus]